MPTCSQDRVLCAIERIAGQGAAVTNRSVLDELRAFDGRGASFGTIGPLVRAWHAAHPAAPRAGRIAGPGRDGGRQPRTLDAAITALVDKRIAEHHTVQRDEEGQTMDALRREVAELTVMLRTVLDTLAKQGSALRNIDERVRDGLSDRPRQQRARDRQSPAPRRPRARRMEEDSGKGRASPTRSTPVPQPTMRNSTEAVAARALGRSVVDAVFDVLVSRGERAPSRPAMTADEIIDALPSSLRSQIAARTGRPPNRRYLARLLRPRIDRERYVRRDTDGCYIAVPDWRERKERARLTPSPV